MRYNAKKSHIFFVFEKKKLIKFLKSIVSKKKVLVNKKMNRKKEKKNEGFFYAFEFVIVTYKNNLNDILTRNINIIFKKIRLIIIRCFLNDNIKCHINILFNF